MSRPGRAARLQPSLRSSSMLSVRPKRSSQLDVDERAAAADVARLSDELVELERGGARGEPIPQKTRAAIEAAVAAAKARVGEPWPERRAALRAVRRDRADGTQRFASANFSALFDEWSPDCVRAAQRVDAAAQEVLDAAADHDRCHQRVEAVAQIVLAQTAYGDVPPCGRSLRLSVTIPLHLARFLSRPVIVGHDVSQTTARCARYASFPAKRGAVTHVVTHGDAPTRRPAVHDRLTSRRNGRIVSASSLGRSW